MSVLPIKGNAYGTIEPREVTTRGPERPAEFTDEAALKLVVQDAQTAEAWLDTQQWKLSWKEADVLYQSPRTLSTFENSTTPRANVSRFTVAKHVNSIVPAMTSGLFYQDPPFVLRPSPSVTQETIRAKTTVFSRLLDQMDFESETEVGLESQVLNGTAVWKWGHATETTIQKKYVRKNAPARVQLPFAGEQEIDSEESDELEVTERKTTRWAPFFEQKPLGTIFVDPGWRDPNRIWKAKFVIERAYLTFEDLNKLREQPGYDIPSEEELKQLFFAPKEQPESIGVTERQQNTKAVVHHAEERDLKTTEDPTAQGLEVLERWDKHKVITVLQKKLIIRNQEHELGVIPYLSCNFWNIQNAGYGLGLGRLIGADQRVEQGSMNAALDILSFAVNPQVIRKAGQNAPTQQIRQRLGGIIDVDDDVDKAFKIAETPKVPAEIWTVIQQSKNASESVSGADEAMVQGQIPGRGSSIVRTATGAGGVAAASAARIQGPVGKFVKYVFKPFLRHLDAMVREHMPVSELRRILGDTLGDAFRLDVDNFFNASLEYEVLAGAHLAAKKAMAQALPFMIQVLENPHLVQQLNQTGYVIDVKEIFEMFMEMSEWKNSRQVIRPMTPQEQQSFQQFNAALQKMQQQLQLVAAKHQATSAEIEQKGETALAGKLVEHAVDRSSEGGYDAMLAAGPRAAAYLERQDNYQQTRQSPFVS